MTYLYRPPAVCLPLTISFNVENSVDSTACPYSLASDSLMSSPMRMRMTAAILSATY